MEIESAGTTNTRTQLTVEASSTPAEGGASTLRRHRKPALSVYDTRTGKLIGKLKHVRKNQYRGRFRVRVRPERVPVRCDRGAAATRAVTGS